MHINLYILTDWELRVLERYTAELNAASRRAGTVGQLYVQQVATGLLRRAIEEKRRQYEKQDASDKIVMGLANLENDEGV